MQKFLYHVAAFIFVVVCCVVAFLFGAKYSIENSEMWILDLPYNENGIIEDYAEIDINIFGQWYEHQATIG